MTDWPHPLIETHDLAERLEDFRLRLLECTTVVTPLPDNSGYRAESGRPLYAAGHLPGAVFADLLTELSDTTSPLRFTMPGPEHLAQALGQVGVGPGTFVVIYCRSHNTMAARLWWMLRAIGFDDAAVLNGGWKKWTSEGRLVTTEVRPYPRATLVARPRPGLFVAKEAVLSALGDPATTLINALSREQHEGRGGIHYGRTGRISGSRCVPAGELTDPATQAYLSPDRLREMFAEAGAIGDQNPRRIITYCGGGIAASSDALVLTMLGVPDVAVYDNSLSEWARDPGLPMEP
jgi:thiosulfate/3-mercaptopyruvate sulfurtransferase